jgi:cyclic pyranopterin phosphate synthase
MVDVGDKPVTKRTAIAEGMVRMPADLVEKFFEGGLSKGDAAAVARIAGIMGAKKTSELIPLCHPIVLSSVDISLEPAGHGIAITATVSTTSQTGVEMEALTAVSTAALTVYDMVKSVERGVTIEEVRLRMKEGGRTGTWERSEDR